MKNYTEEIFRDRETPEEFPVEDVCKFLSKVSEISERLECHDENDAFMIKRLNRAVDDFRISLGLPTRDEQDDLDGLSD